MTVFVIVVVLMVLAAVSVVILPLLRQPKQTEQTSTDSATLSLGVLRDHLADLEREFAAGHLNAESYAAEKAEIERRALEDSQQRAPDAAPRDVRRTGLVVAISVVVPALVLGLYYMLGTPEAITGKAPAAQQAHGEGDAPHELTREQIEGMVEKLAERLMDNPGDGAGWHMLARSYGVLGRYTEGAAAYGRAVTLLPPDAQLYADYADMLAVAQGRNLSGEPEKLIRMALQVDPRNVKALALSGSAAFKRNDYRMAIAEWRKILDIVPPDSDISASIRSSIADAESRLSGAAPAPSNQAAAGASVSGLVELDPALRQKAAPDDTLFIFAHAVDGPRLPLAVLRKKVSDLPVQFTLDDSMAMTPKASLSQFSQITVSARISKSGDPLPHSGDLEATRVSTVTGASGLKLTIANEVK